MNDEVLLQARLGDLWENVYRFATTPTYPIDHEVGNWFTSTKPGGLFTENVIAARPTPMCRRTFFNGDMTVRDLDNKAERMETKDPAMLREILDEQFGIDLLSDDPDVVFSAMRRFAGRPGPGFMLD